MKAVVEYEAYDIRIEQREKPKPGPNDLLLENVHTGVCGTDVNRYKGFWEEGRLTLPFIVGHEYSGVVAEVGKNVKGFKVGDKVFGNFQGSLCEYCVVPSNRAYILPKEASLVEATSLFPVSGTLHGIKRSGIKIGDSIAILGPGHAGLLLTQWARIAGAGKVITTGTRENRLKIARDLGADFTVNTREEDPVKKCIELTDGIGPDIVIEATGRPDAVVQAVDMIRPDGTIVIFGVAQEPVEKFDTFKIYRKRLNFLGTQGRTDEERNIGVKYLRTGRITVKPIITHILPLEDTKKGFETVDKRLEDVIRMVIKS